MARRNRKRRYKNRPGLTEAALALGVDYSHLRRVIAGKRPSAHLLRQYFAFSESQKSPVAKTATPDTQ